MLNIFIWPYHAQGQGEEAAQKRCMRWQRRMPQPSSRVEVIGGSFEQGAQDVRLRKQRLNLFLSPLLGGHVLQKHYLYRRRRQRQTADARERVNGHGGGGRTNLLLALNV